jgi:5,10-methylenetetrahydrofolate reductase
MWVVAEGDYEKSIEIIGERNPFLAACRRMIKRIKDENMCDGVHIMAIGKEDKVPEIMAAAGLIQTDQISNPA